MERTVKNKSILDKFCIDFCKVVEKHCKYIIVSGFVAIASGRTRGTEGIDMIVPLLSPIDFTDLHNNLKKKGFACVQSDNPKTVYGYLRDKLSVRYTRKNEFLPEMEIKFCKDSIDELQLKTRVKLPFTHLDVWFSSPEANIAFKEEYLKSDKDLKDAKHLRLVYANRINKKEIARIKKEIKRLRM